jgi:hypothetical protein
MRCIINITSSEEYPFNHSALGNIQVIGSVPCVTDIASKQWRQAEGLYLTGIIRGLSLDWIN